MTELTVNLENCNKEEKQKAIDIIICYAAPINKATHTIVVMVEDEKVSHLISSLPSSVIITNQTKLENNTNTPQIQHSAPTGWIIISKEHYLELHVKITELQKMQNISEEIATVSKDKYEKLKSLYKDLIGTINQCCCKFPKDL
jgi:hypothetical protein